MTKEPLFHFLALALLIFAYFAVFPRNNSDETEFRKIIIGQEKIERLRAEWAQSWRRSPSELQLNNLIESAIKEEVYYREAVILGLDENDSVVRNRMIQKMRFLQSEELSEPTYGDLTNFFKQNAAKYKPETRYSFQQVYLGQGDDLRSVSINELIKRLNSGLAKPSDISRPLSVPSTFAGVSNSKIVRQFGEDFANAVNANEQLTSNWFGPIVSGFGLHLVRLNQVQVSSAASIDDSAIRQRVENDWRAAQGKALEERIYMRLRENYTVQILKGE